MKRWLVTGGAGFIGSCFVRRALLEGWADEVVVLDALTYAGNVANLEPVHGHPGYRFVRGDVRSENDVRAALQDGTEAVFHFAAESHVDRSILSASDFVTTNVLGTQVMLDVSRRAGVRRFVHVSTDEVYGSLELGSQVRFTEESPIDPTSPYAASKASSDHLALAACRTHGLDVVVTRCSNNYGPYQFPEKFVPLFITNAFEGKPLPLYGDGLNVRDWIHVEDHAEGVRLAYAKGEKGRVYNLGGECERANVDIARAIVKVAGAQEGSIQHVKDRLAHDRRYAIDCSRAKKELGFVVGPSIEERLAGVVKWYKEHEGWWMAVKSGAYREYYQKMYG